MVLSCEIIIQEPSKGVHRAGKPVSGVLRYSLSKATEFLIGTLKLVGEATCEIKIGSGSLVEYEKFLEKNKKILAEKQKTIKFAPGNYEFEFKFVLPKNTPSSFKGKYGKITYKIEAEFFKSFGFINTSDRFKEHIKVYGFVDATGLLEKRMYGIRKEFHKIFSTKESKVKIKAECKSLIKPGKEAKLKLKVNNDTNMKIPFVKVELICQSTFIYHGCLATKPNIVKKTIKSSTVRSDPVPANNKAKFSMKIPTPKSLYSVQNCSIIQNEFYLLVTLNMPFPYRNASVNIPLVLGESWVDSPKSKGSYVAKDNNNEPERNTEPGDDKEEVKAPNDLNVDDKLELVQDLPISPADEVEHKSEESLDPSKEFNEANQQYETSGTGVNTGINGAILRL